MLAKIAYDEGMGEAQRRATRPAPSATAASGSQEGLPTSMVTPASVAAATAAERRTTVDSTPSTDKTISYDPDGQTQMATGVDSDGDISLRLTPKDIPNALGRRDSAESRMSTIARGLAAMMPSSARRPTKSGETKRSAEDADQKQEGSAFPLGLGAPSLVPAPERPPHSGLTPENAQMDNMAATRKALSATLRLWQQGHRTIETTSEKRSVGLARNTKGRTKWTALDPST